MDKEKTKHHIPATKGCTVEESHKYCYVTACGRKIKDVCEIKTHPVAGHQFIVNHPKKDVKCKACRRTEIFKRAWT